MGSGETLEKDEVLDARIQPTDGSYFVQTCAADEEAKQISYLVLYGPDVEEGSVLVLLPDDEQDVKILFDAGTDAREAEKKALADYQAASEGKPLPSEEETGGRVRGGDRSSCREAGIRVPWRNAHQAA